VKRIGLYPHLGTVQESDGEKLSVPAPRPDRRRRRLRAEPPIPAQVARMQLYRRGVVLPVSKGAHDVAELADVRSAQLDCHGRDQTSLRRQRAPRICGSTD
jgi:hypothetical protein